jgi:uncharacterized membrane protein
MAHRNQCYGEWIISPQDITAVINRMTTHHGRVRNRDDFVLMVLIRVTNNFSITSPTTSQFYSVPILNKRMYVSIKPAII